MKKVLFSFVVASSFFACSVDHSKIQNYIPADVNSVVIINQQAIIGELKWDIALGNDKLKFQSLKNPILKQILENPASSGLEWMGKSYIFNSDSTGSVAIIPLTNPEDLLTLLESEKILAKDAGSYKALYSNGNSIFIDDNAMFLFFDSLAINKGESIINKLKDDSQKSLVNSTTGKGKEIFTSEHHISMYQKGSSLSSIFDNILATISASESKSEKNGSESVSFFDFKNGVLEGTSDEYFANGSHDQKTFEKSGVIEQLASGLNQKDPVLDLAISTNLSSLLLSGEKSLWKHQADSLLGLYMGASTEMLEPIFGGDALITFNGLNISMGMGHTETGTEHSTESEMDYEMKPVFNVNYTLAITLKDTIMGRGLIERALVQYAPTIKNSVFYIPTFNSYLFFKGNYVYATGDSNVVKTIMATPAESKNNLYSNFNNGLTINFQGLSKKLPLEFLPMFAPAINTIEKKLVKVSYVAEPAKGNTMHSKFILEGKNKEENILITILDLMNELGGNSTPQS